MVSNCFQIKFVNQGKVIYCSNWIELLIHQSCVYQWFLPFQNNAFGDQSTLIWIKVFGIFFQGQISDLNILHPEQKTSHSRWESPNCSSYSESGRPERVSCEWVGSVCEARGDSGRRAGTAHQGGRAQRSRGSAPGAGVSPGARMWRCDSTEQRCVVCIWGKQPTSPHGNHRSFIGISWAQENILASFVFHLKKKKKWFYIFFKPSRCGCVHLLQQLTGEQCCGEWGASSMFAGYLFFFF